MNTLRSNGSRQNPTRAVSPRTALERQMVELWQRVLARKSIGITDDFLELGGYSLRACIDAIQRYRPEFAFESELLYFRAHPSERRIGVQDHEPKAGWGSHISGEIAVVPIDGKHGSILNPSNRDAIARRYHQHIDELGLSV